MSNKFILFLKNNWLYVFFFCFIISIFYFLDSSLIVNAYHFDEITGNMVSDNLINCPDTSSYEGSWGSEQICYVEIENDTDYSISMQFNKVDSSGNGGLAVFLSDEIPSFTLGGWFPDVLEGYERLKVEEAQNANWNTTFNSRDYNYIAIYNGKTGSDRNGTINNIKIMLNEGNNLLPYEAYGVYYSQSNVDILLKASLDVLSATAVWEGNVNSVDILSHLINQDGLLWFDNAFNYIDYFVSDSYENADISILFGQRMPINVNYSFSVNGSIGSSIAFYQGNSRLYSINVTDGFEDQCSSVPSANLCVINLADKIDTTTYLYFDKIVVTSVRPDYIPVSFGFYSNSYYIGYDKGLIDGYDVGHSNGFTDGESFGYRRGYDDGYNSGLLYQDTYGPNTLVGLVGAIFSGPVTMMQSIFDFDFLGINLSQFFFSLISLLIVVWLVIKFL